MASNEVVLTKLITFGSTWAGIDIKIQPRGEEKEKRRD